MRKRCDGLSDAGSKKVLLPAPGQMLERGGISRPGPGQASKVAEHILRQPGNIGPEIDAPERFASEHFRMVPPKIGCLILKGFLHICAGGGLSFFVRPWRRNLDVRVNSLIESGCLSANGAQKSVLGIVNAAWIHFGQSDAMVDNIKKAHFQRQATPSWCATLSSDGGGSSLAPPRRENEGKRVHGLAHLQASV